eukprot:jgi/Mesen1/9116/ME000058S08604
MHACMRACLRQARAGCLTRVGLRAWQCACVATGQADMWPQMEGYLPWEPLPRPALQGADERCEALFGHGYNATYHLFGSPLLLPMHQPQPLPAAMAEALRAAKVVARTGSATSKETEGESSGSHASHGGGGGGDAASGLLGESAGAGPAGLKAERGWLTCHHNGVTSIGVCEGSMLVMHPDRIRMSAGGERIADVMNRAESDELPQFAPGAFEVPGGGVRGAGAWRMDAGVVEKMTAQSVGAAHKLRELLFSVRAVESATCYEVVEEPTLFIVRYDYAHIYFTMLDWYNAYSAARVAGIKRRPNIVFVDGHSQRQEDVVEIIAPLEGGGAQDGVNPEFGFGGALAGLPHRVIGGQGQGQAEDEGQEAGVSWARGDVRSRVDQLREHHFFESMVAHHPALRNCSCGRWEALAAAAAAAEPGWQRAALNPGEGGATALPLTFNVSPALALQAEAKGGDDAHTGGEEGQDEQATEEGQDEQATEVEVQEEAEQATQGEGQDEETMLAEDEGDAPQVEAGGEEEAQDEQQQQQQQQAAGIEYGEVRTVEVAADEQSKGQSARRQAGTGGHDSLASGSAGSSLAGSGDRGGDLRDSGASLPRGAVALRGNSWQQGAGRFPQALVHRLPRGSTRRLQRRRLRRRLLAATGNVEPDSSETRMLKWLVERMPGHTVVTVPLSALQQPLNGQDPKGGSSGGGGSDAQQQQQQQASGGGGPSGRSDSGSSDGGGLFPPCTGDGPCTICLCRD